MKKIYTVIVVLGCLGGSLYAMEEGAWVAAAVPAGESELHRAARGGNVAEVQSLLEKAGDVDVQDSQGLRPLFLAALRGHCKIVELLLGRGADVNARSHDGRPLLYLAFMGGHCEVVELLLKHGADMNVVGMSGWTFFHEACARGFCEIIELLLKRGADPTVNLRGRRLVDEDCLRPEVRQLLCNAITRRRAAGIWALAREHEREVTTETGEKRELPQLTYLPPEIVKEIIYQVYPELWEQELERRKLQREKGKLPKESWTFPE